MRRFFAFVVDHPKPILGVFLVITLLMGSFLFRLRIDTDIRRMVGKDQAVIAELDEIVDEFGAQTYLLITLKADDVFDPATLAFLQRVADEVEGLPGVIEVRHPLNLEIIQGSEWGIEIRPVVASLPTTGEEIEAFRQSLLANAHGRQLVSADGRGALIIAKLDPDILGTKGEWELARRVEDLLAREKDYELYANGDIVVSDARAKAIEQVAAHRHRPLPQRGRRPGLPRVARAQSRHPPAGRPTGQPQRLEQSSRMRWAASTHSASGATRAMRTRLAPGFSPFTSRDR